MTKHVEVPEVPPSQLTDKVIDKHVVAQRQIPMVQAVQMTMGVPQLQCIDEAIDGTVVQVPRVQVVEKTVEGPQLQIVEQIIETPETQTIRSTQTSESLGGAPVRQVAQAETVKDDPDAQIKFLAAEALHGVHGNLLANDCVTGEMWKNDCVTGEIWKKKLPFRLALNRAASDDIAWQCKHYNGRVVRKLHESGTALAEDMEAPVSKMPHSSEAHDQVLDRVDDVPVSRQRQTPLIQRVQKTVEVPQIQYVDKIVDAPTQLYVPAEAETLSQDRVDDVSVAAQEQGCRESCSKKRKSAFESDEMVDEASDLDAFVSSKGGMHASGGRVRSPRPRKRIGSSGAKHGGRWLTPPGHVEPGMGRNGRVPGASGKETRREGGRVDPEARAA